MAGEANLAESGEQICGRENCSEQKELLWSLKNAEELVKRQIDIVQRLLLSLVRSDKVYYNQW